MPKDGYFLSDDGLRLRYRIIGNGPHTVIVPLMHWNIDQFNTIAGQEFRFIFYDPRNRGASDATSDVSRLSISHDMYDLAAIQRLLRVKKISLIGTSYYGGMVARYAMLFPEKVDRLIMVGPLPLEAHTLTDYDPPEKATIVTDEDRAELARLRQEGVESYEPERFCGVYWSQQNRLSVGRPEWGSRIRNRCQYPNEWPRNFTRWVNQVIGSLGQWDWTAAAGNMAVPVLVIHGSRDLRVPLEGSREWVRTLPQSRLLVIEGAGHSPWHGMPEKIFPMVRTFLLGAWPYGVDGVVGGER